MKKIILFFILTISLSAFPQDKYFIYFKDKGVDRTLSLQKTSSIYKKAESMLSEKSLKRRQVNMNADSLITFEDLPIREDYVNTLKGLGVDIKNSLKWFNAVTAYLTDEQVKDLKKLDFVKGIRKVRMLKVKNGQVSAEPETGRLKKSIPVDTSSYGLSFTQLNLSDIPIVHANGITGKGVILGILDSGFGWKEHEALKNARVIAEHDYLQNDNITENQAQDNSTQDGHGTFVFSIVSGYKPGTYLGAAYDAGILLAKTEDVINEGHFEEDNYAHALEWMESLGVDITTSSLGYSDMDDAQTSYTYDDMDGKTAIVTKAAELAFRRGIVVVNSAGNEGNKTWHYITAPADGNYVITCGAVNSDNELAPFSGRGPTSDGRIKPDLTAMGVNNVGALPRAKVFGYNYSSGTSFSSPIVSSVAALLLSAYPHLKNYQVRQILLESGDNAASPDNERGYGLISAARAIEFPNLEQTRYDEIIHKAFINSANIKSGTLRFNITGQDSAFTFVDMKSDKEGFYSASLPVINMDALQYCYFTYIDNSGRSVRVPSAGNYTMRASRGDISLNVKNAAYIAYPEDFVLSQNYPNPFNGLTRIDYKAQANEQAELFIINSIGQKVKYYSKLSDEGINYFHWDGKMDDGNQCASGVYYYILRLAGRDYGKKMVLLK